MSSLSMLQRPEPRSHVHPPVRVEAEEDPLLAPPVAARAHLSTGVRRLDALLGGGFPAGSSTLLYGPPFSGKKALQYNTFVNAAVGGIPSTYLLHTQSAQAMSARLRKVHPGFAAAEEAGHVTYLDLCSNLLGERADHPNTVYVDDPLDLVRFFGSFEPKPTEHPSPAVPSLLAIESASTLMLDVGVQRMFRFLRSALGRITIKGGVAILGLEAGMHPEAEVQMVKHLCHGMIELRKKGDANYLHVEGLETAFARPGWVEYEFGSHTFNVTGSFTSKSIA